MSNTEPIAYTYEADTHCPSCAESRFGKCEHGFIACPSGDHGGPHASGYIATDAEGNDIGAVFQWDDTTLGIVCSDCSTVIVEGPGYDYETGDGGRCVGEESEHWYEGHGRCGHCHGDWEAIGQAADVAVPLTDRTCATCGTVAQTCSFCRDEARHFIGANVLAHPDGADRPYPRVDATVYFCDSCAEAITTQRFRDDGHRPATGPVVELGAYTPNETCQDCDSW